MSSPPRSTSAPLSTSSPSSTSARLATSLPRSSAAAQGIAAAGILAFLDAAQPLDVLHSFMLARHGHVVAEGWWHPYQVDRPHMMFSVSKSFTSTAVGLAVEEGLLSVDDPVLAFFPDAAPATVSPHLETMRVRHLLTMTTGHAVDTTDVLLRRDNEDWAAAFLAQPVEYEPGTRFVYDSGASYLLSAIVQRLTGLPLVEYLRPRLFEPLGIAQPQWESCPRGVNCGGWGLNLRTEDMLLFGQLYLNGGVCNGERLLPLSWVEEATGCQVPNDAGDPLSDSQQGYGYQFWRSRNDSYRADGAFGQFCVVLPNLDAVVAITSGTGEMQALLDLVWTHLVPAMVERPLPDDDVEQSRLEERLARLTLRGLRTSTVPMDVSGRVYRAVGSPVRRVPVRAGGLPMIETIGLRQGPGGWVVDLVDELGRHEFVCGDGEWRAALGVDGVTPLAVTGGWSAEDVFVFQLCLTATPFIRTYSCRFDGLDVTVTAHDNVSFGSTGHPPVLARATSKAGVDDVDK